MRPLIVDNLTGGPSEDLAQDWSTDSSEYWIGGSQAQARAYLRDGDNASVAKAKELRDRILEGFDLSRYGRVACDTVAGGSVNVGRFIAGAPDCMRGYEVDHTDHAPIRVVVGCMSAAGVHHTALLSRGIACVALCQALSAFRPVTLEAMWGSSPCGAVDVVTTMPLPINDLSACAAVLAQPAISRGVMYARASRLAGKNPGDLDWPSRSEVELARVTDEDLLVPSPRLSDGGPVATDPVGWVREKLEKLLNGENCETAV